MTTCENVCAKNGTLPYLFRMWVDGRRAVSDSDAVRIRGGFPWLRWDEAAEKRKNGRCQSVKPFRTMIRESAMTSTVIAVLFKVLPRLKRAKMGNPIPRRLRISVKILRVSLVVSAMYCKLEVKLVMQFEQ